MRSSDIFGLLGIVFLSLFAILFWASDFRLWKTIVFSICFLLIGKWIANEQKALATKSNQERGAGGK